MKRRILFLGSKPIGDTLCTINLLQYLIQEMRHVKVTVIAKNPMTKEIFEAIPEVEKILTFYSGKGTFKNALKCLWLYSSCYWEVFISANVKTASITKYFLSFIFLRWRCKYFLLPGPFKKLDTIPRPHYMATSIDWGDDPFPNFYLDIPLRHREEAEKILPLDNHALMFSPFARDPSRSWPIDYFTELAKRLTQDGPMHKAVIVISGAAAQRPLLSYLLKSFPRDQIILLMGNNHMMTVAACMARSRLFITNDSGLMHVASLTLQKPFLSIFSSAPETGWNWSEYNHSIRANQSSKKWILHRDHPVLLPVDTVYQAALRILEKTS